MSSNNTPETLSTLNDVAIEFRKDLTGDHRKEKDLVLLFAHNGTGKTRLSMEFKDIGKADGGRDTLYFNAFTEDLFVWNNDFEDDTHRELTFNSDSAFFEGLQDFDMENRVRPLYQTYDVDVDFRIDYDNYKIVFFRSVVEEEVTQTIDNIKISRGEENLFIWCFFMAICEIAIDHVSSEDDAGAYNWVRFFYIDDPISSLDENNAIAVACHIADLLKRDDNTIKTVISTHHSLFFNVMYNESKNAIKQKFYYLHCNSSGEYILRNTKDTPFFHHVAVISKLKQVAEEDDIYTYHFNALRSVLEKTAIFFGYDNISKCLEGLESEVLFNRALNLMSHGKFSLFDSQLMGDDTKKLFRDILDGFLNKYEFHLPEIFNETTETEA